MGVGGGIEQVVNESEKDFEGVIIIIISCCCCTADELTRGAHEVAVAVLLLT